MTDFPAWATIAAAVIVMVGIPAIMFWRNRPTPTEQAVYELGFNDGAEGRELEQFGHPDNQRLYLEGYQDGSRGRTRRADAERLKARTEGRKE